MGKRKPMKTLTARQSEMARVIESYLTGEYVIYVLTNDLYNLRVYGQEFSIIKRQLREEQGWKQVAELDWASLGFLLRPARTLKGKKVVIITKQERVMSERELKEREKKLRRVL